MSRNLRLPLLAAAAALALAVSASAQAHAGPPPEGQHHHHGPHPKPVNLQVLPKDLTGDQVMDIMHHFTGELGVECDYCHAVNPATHHLDPAADTNPVKDRARLMIRMNMDINQHFIAELQNPPATNKVSCGTCHRGNPKPTLFVPPPDEHHHDGPPPQGPPPAGAPAQ